MFMIDHGHSWTDETLLKISIVNVGIRFFRHKLFQQITICKSYSWSWWVEF